MSDERPFALPSPHEPEDREDDAPAEVKPVPIPLTGQRGLRASLPDLFRPAERAFGELALHRATSPAQRRAIVFGKGVVVVVRVPTAAWIRPIVDLLQFHTMWDKAIGGANVPVKARSIHDENGDDWVSAMIGRGGRVLGVSHDPQRFLPPALVAAADITFTLPTVDNATVAGVIGAVLDSAPPRHMPPGVAAGLDLSDLVAAIRRGSTPARCVERLITASASRSVVDPSVEAAPLLQDLHGYGTAMDWCQDLVAELDAWRVGRGPFPDAPRVVLSGPPGTGKTTLARSLARTAGLPLIASSVAAWFADSSGHLDAVIKAVDAVFERARALAPCVLLLDEIDALPNRLTMSPRGRDWWSPVIAHCLLTLDSAVSGANRGLIIVAATNHAELLDPALVRPGRLERIIEVMPPHDPADRAAILRGHLGRDLPADADLTTVAEATPHATGAVLMAIARQARRRARTESRAVTVDDLMHVAAPPDTRPEAVRRRYALHESGHAVVGEALGLVVRLLSTVAAGPMGGMCSFMPFGEYTVTLSEARDHATMWLGGMAAEQSLLGERSTGAGGPFGSDLGRATYLLRTLRLEHGLGRTLSHAPVADDAPPWATPSQIAADVEVDLQAALVRATAIIIERRAAVEALADALMDRRILDGTTVRKIITAHPPGTPSAAPAIDRSDASPAAANERRQSGSASNAPDVASAPGRVTRLKV